MKKIALEEHFITPELLPDTQKIDFSAMDPKQAEDFQIRLLDFEDLRIKAMDEAGVEISVLSLTDPGIQGIKDTKSAVAAASKTNAFLAEKISKNPKRFRGFACLAMQDPMSAANELEHCVNQYGFLGALINGQTLGSYLDEEKFLPFWKKTEELNVPIYLHPGNPLHVSESYKNHPELDGPIWGWTAETATHALRLVFSGLFDKFPKIQVILGHMGETLPYLLWRIDSRWGILKKQKELKELPSQYLRNNFYVTSSGMCSNGPLLCALQELGEDRVMFSIDYPYESSNTASQFIEKAPMDKKALEKVCYKNAEQLLKI
ncbi:amidohydrolase family protein [Criblamydia sequanensis]|uniref:Amidohydrolase n=1 Tax=Candidatus Criblamydia sequanensis CRIB-18 TaxID=1437425 RepID=A0A090E041_9BACT|nr:amidohydrolase family protein [Criblamydia sequanensis]CDR34209.1 Amidohydrolase [Criblamydia sequanensis CRIB-18]